MINWLKNTLLKYKESKSEYLVKRLIFSKSEWFKDSLSCLPDVTQQCYVLLCYKSEMNRQTCQHRSLPTVSEETYIPTITRWDNMRKTIHHMRCSNVWLKHRLLCLGKIKQISYSCVPSSTLVPSQLFFPYSLSFSEHVSFWIASNSCHWKKKCIWHFAFIQ